MDLGRQRIPWRKKIVKTDTIVLCLIDDSMLFDDFVSPIALKVQISLPKISFRSKFDQKSLLVFLWIFQFRLFGFVTFLQNFTFLIEFTKFVSKV